MKKYKFKVKNNFIISYLILKMKHSELKYIFQLSSFSNFLQDLILHNYLVILFFLTKLFYTIYLYSILI